MARAVKISENNTMLLLRASLQFLANGDVKASLLKYIDIVPRNDWSQDTDAQNFHNANIAFQTLGILFNKANRIFQGMVVPTAYEERVMSTPNGFAPMMQENVEAWLLMQKDHDLINLCNFADICRKFAHSPALSEEKWGYDQEQLEMIAQAFEDSGLQAALDRIVKPQIPLLAAARNTDGASAPGRG